MIVNGHLFTACNKEAMAISYIESDLVFRSLLAKYCLLHNLSRFDTLYYVINADRSVLVANMEFYRQTEAELYRYICPFLFQAIHMSVFDWFSFIVDCFETFCFRQLFEG